MLGHRFFGDASALWPHSFQGLGIVRIGQPALRYRMFEVLPELRQIDAALGVHLIAAVELDHLSNSASTSRTTGSGSCQSHSGRSQKPGRTSLLKTPFLGYTR